MWKMGPNGVVTHQDSLDLNLGPNEATGGGAVMPNVGVAVASPEPRKFTDAAARETPQTYRFRLVKW